MIGTIANHIVTKFIKTNQNVTSLNKFKVPKSEFKGFDKYVISVK